MVLLIDFKKTCIHKQNTMDTPDFFDFFNYINWKYPRGGGEGGELIGRDDIAKFENGHEENGYRFKYQEVKIGYTCNLSGKVAGVFFWQNMGRKKSLE